MTKKIGKSLFIVDSTGATLTRWQYNGKDIIAPFGQSKQSDGSIKFRGGIPICLPKFGPAYKDRAREINLIQHGFLRNTEMEKLNGEEVGYVKNFSKTKAYPFSFEVFTRFKMKENGFSHVLGIKNNELKANMPICPGIHPYFKTPHGQCLLKINDEKQELLNLISLKKKKEDRLVHLGKTNNVIELDNHENVLKIKLGKGYDHIVIWTDDPTYICIEPIASNPELFGTENGLWLEPNPHGIVLKCDIKITK